MSEHAPRPALSPTFDGALTGYYGHEVTVLLAGGHQLVGTLDGAGPEYLIVTQAGFPPWLIPAGAVAAVGAGSRS